MPKRIRDKKIPDLKNKDISILDNGEISIKGLYNGKIIQQYLPVEPPFILLVNSKNDNFYAVPVNLPDFEDYEFVEFVEAFEDVDNGNTRLQ